MTTSIILTFFNTAFASLILSVIFIIPYLFSMLFFIKSYKNTSLRLKAKHFSVCMLFIFLISLISILSNNINAYKSGEYIGRMVGIWLLNSFFIFPFIIAWLFRIKISNNENKFGVYDLITILLFIFPYLLIPNISSNSHNTYHAGATCGMGIIILVANFGYYLIRKRVGKAVGTITIFAALIVIGLLSSFGAKSLIKIRSREIGSSHQQPAMKVNAND